MSLRHAGILLLECDSLALVALPSAVDLKFLQFSR
jgi:hypothetical protein